MDLQTLLDLESRNELVGVHDNIDNETYHRGPGESRSSLLHLGSSVEHYLYRKTVQSDPSKEMMEGTWFHTMLMEPEKAAADYLVADVANFGTIAYQKEAKNHPGKQLIPTEVYERLSRMVDRARSVPKIGQFLGGFTEMAGYWYEDGVLCKTKPDKFEPNLRMIIDFKTTKDAAPLEFARSCVNYGYDVQAAMAIDGINQAYKQEAHRKFSATTSDVVDSVVFVAVESVEPHGVALYTLGAEEVGLGRIKYQRCIQKLKAFQKGEVPRGYGDQIQELKFPGWAYTQ